MLAVKLWSSGGKHNGLSPPILISVFNRFSEIACIICTDAEKLVYREKVLYNCFFISLRCYEDNIIKKGTYEGFPERLYGYRDDEDLTKSRIHRQGFYMI